MVAINLSTITRLAVAADGTQGSNSSSQPVASTDGRYVAFQSNASNLVTGDTNGQTDIFWRDTNLTSTTADDAIVRISVAADGTQGSNFSYYAIISGDGRYVAFRGGASNLVAGDTNNAGDIFWRDTNLTSTTADDAIVRLSVAADGTEATNTSGGTLAQSISSDGRYVVFRSTASNLVAGDTNGQVDIFWRDTNLTSTTADDAIVRLSVAADGTQGGDISFRSAISPNGRYVVFESNASNLVAGDTNASRDIFWRDTNLTSVTSDDSIVRLSVAADGTQGGNGSYHPAVSNTGRYVVFSSVASNLVAGDTNGVYDIFWRDTNLTSTTADDVIARISLAADGTQGNATSYSAPRISNDGRYVVFRSSASNLVTGDTNGRQDIFLRDTNLTSTTADDAILRVSVSTAGGEGNNNTTYLAISGDGNYVVFSGDASNLVTGDTNSRTDVFTARLSSTGGNDNMLGSDSGETISGGAGSDTVSGAGGNDTLSGGTGDDTLSGGSGNDAFNYAAAGDGTDDIADFASGDTIVVAGANFATSGAISAGTGTAVGQNMIQVGTTAGGVTPIYIGTDAGAGAEITINLTGTFTSSSISASGTTISFGSPPSPPASPPASSSDGGSSPPPPTTTSTTTATTLSPEPPPTATVAGSPPPPPPLSIRIGDTDGLVIAAVQNTNSDGSRSVTVTIPTVTTSRVEALGAAPTADLRLVTDTDGTTAVELDMPLGTGGQTIVENNRETPAQSLDDLIRAITRVTSDTPTDLSNATGVGSGFLTELPTTGQVVVTTFIPTVTSDFSSTGTPIGVVGRTDATGSMYEAFVIDARGLPAGSTLTLQEVEFASIRGNVTISGGDGAQNAVGDSSAQNFFLGAGDDTLRGGGGNDTVRSAAGNDRLYGDAGDDTVMGGAGNDLVYGNAGTDLVYGNQGADRAYGGQGNDTVFGGQDADMAYGNLGDDIVYGNFGADTLYGGQGSDILYGGRDGDMLAGGAGSDTLVGGAGDDLFVLAGDGSVDTIVDFGTSDAMSLTGSFASGAITRSVGTGTTALGFDTNGDGAVDVNVTLIGSYGGTFSAAASGGTTLVTYSETVSPPPPPPPINDAGGRDEGGWQHFPPPPTVPLIGQPRPWEGWDGGP